MENAHEKKNLPEDAKNIEYRFFNGRLNRSNYWLGTMLLNILLLFVHLLARSLGIYELNPFYIISDAHPANDLEAFMLWLQVAPLVIFAALYVSVSMSFVTRRNHDLGRDVAGLPMFIWSYYLYFRRGDPDTNKFGKPQHGFSLHSILGMN